MKHPTTYLFLLSLCCFFAAGVVAQESADRPRLEEKKWEELTRNLDYGEPKEKTPERSKPARQHKAPPIGGNAAGAMRVLLFILAAVAIAVIIAMVLGVGKPKNKKIENDEIRIEDIEDNLQETALDGFIRRALEQQNYSLAVRLYYLGILKELAAQRIIRWKKDKTNREYLLETADRPWHNRWEDITRLFERVRYGGVSLTHEDFLSVQEQFQDFYATIRSPNPTEA